MSAISRPLAIFGGPLEGSSQVRYIFIDEAGTSEREPISVVAGIIVHADEQCVPAEAKVAEVLEAIPTKFREAFPVFHAKKIWGSDLFRDEWTLEDRKKVLMDMMSIPKEIGMPISFGLVSREAVVPPDAMIRNTAAQAHHALALQNCLGEADRWMKHSAKSNEIATVIAEDVPESKRLLKFVARWSTKSPGEYQISRIRMPIHFVTKGEEPLLQIADACAFGIRRYISKYSHGEDFLQAIGSTRNIGFLNAERPLGSGTFCKPPA